MRRLGVLALAGAAVLAAGSGAALGRAMEPEVARLTRLWQGLNTTCRGASGDDPRTHAACRRRDVIAGRLRSRGWCYGLPNDLGYQRFWRRCDGTWR